MSVANLERAGAVVLLLLGSQAWARWRVGRRERADAALPLFDAVALEAALAARPPDDPKTLEALRDVFRRLNRVRDEETLRVEAAQFCKAQPPPQWVTLRRALERLSQSEDEALRRLSIGISDQLTPGPHTPADSAR